MAKTIQVNGNFIIMEVEATNHSRMQVKEVEEVYMIGKDYPEISKTLKSDTIKLSIDITLKSNGNTTNVTTESVFGIIQTKLKELTIYP